MNSVLASLAKDLSMLVLKSLEKQTGLSFR